MISLSYLIVFLYWINAIIYFIGIFKLLINRTAKKKEENEKPVISIIIPARNEEQNLGSCLKAMSHQNYRAGKWEVWVIEDRSSDRTAQIAGEYAHAYGHFNLLQVKNLIDGNSAKKNALNLGIQNATGEIIITTDADCIMSNEWLSAMASEFDDQTGMVIGIPVYTFKMKLLEIYQALDYASISVVASAMAANKMALTCSAANLAYRKKVFDEVGGYNAVQHFVSGDDDLLMQKIALTKKWKIKATANKKSFTYTKPVSTWKEVLNQRARWGSKGAFYPLKWVRFYLAFLFLLQLTMIAGWFIFPLDVMALVFLNKFSVDLLMTIMLALVIGNKALFFGLIPVSIFQPLMLVVAAVKGFMGKFNWK